MIVIYWNARGLGNHETRLVLHNLCVKHKPDLLFLSEPWIDIDHFPVRF